MCVCITTNSAMKRGCKVEVVLYVLTYAKEILTTSTI